MAVKFSAVVKTLCAAAAVTFCAAQVQAEVLRVGTEATYAPFEFMDDNVKPQGFDIDIINAVGKAMGYDVEVQNMSFDGLIPALMTSQIDVIIAAMTITEERAKRVDFTEPYYQSGLSILILEENKDKFKKIDDLKSERLCAQIGTTGAMKAQEISGNVAAFNTEPEAFMELKAKGCSGVVNDRPVNLYFLTKSAATGVIEMSERITSESYGIAVRKGNSELLEALNEGLKKIKESGEMAKIHQKWFGVSE